MAIDKMDGRYVGSVIMIETTKESDFLCTLANWFRKVEKYGLLHEGQTNCQEVARHLERIAEKLRLLETHDHMITARKDV